MEITVETTIEAPLEKVWEAWTKPEHIVQWNFASEDWKCPKAEINLTVGGKLKYRMEAMDESMGFDFEGTFIAIDPDREIQYALDDDRKVLIGFKDSDNGVIVIETFEAENELTSEHVDDGRMLDAGNDLHGAATLLTRFEIDPEHAFDEIAQHSRWCPGVQAREVQKIRIKSAHCAFFGREVVEAAKNGKWADLTPSPSPVSTFRRYCNILLNNRSNTLGLVIRRA